MVQLDEGLQTTVENKLPITAETKKHKSLIKHCKADRQTLKKTHQSSGRFCWLYGGWMHVSVFRENCAYFPIFQNHKAMQRSTAGATYCLPLSWELQWTICSRGLKSKEPSFPGPVVSSAQRSLACRLFLCSYTIVPTVASSYVSALQKRLILW